MTAKLGAFCNKADSIVPIPEDGWCEWCGSRHHFIRYRWNEDTRQWDTLTLDPLPRVLIEKPENFTEDGI